MAPDVVYDGYTLTPEALNEIAATIAPSRLRAAQPPGTVDTARSGVELQHVWHNMLPSPGAPGAGPASAAQLAAAAAAAGVPHLAREFALARTEQALGRLRSATLIGVSGTLPRCVRPPACRQRPLPPPLPPPPALGTPSPLAPLTTARSPPPRQLPDAPLLAAIS
jgi:hypothetical protein